jgi:hypothetical protein
VVQVKTQAYFGYIGQFVKSNQIELYMYSACIAQIGDVRQIAHLAHDVLFA